MLLVLFLKLFHYGQRFITSARDCISVAQVLERMSGSFHCHILLELGDCFRIPALLDVDPTDCLVSYGIVRIEVHTSLGLLQRRTEVVLEKIYKRDIDIESGRKRIKFLRALDFCQRLIEPSHEAQMTFIPVVRGLVMPIQSDT